MEFNRQDLLKLKLEYKDKLNIPDWVQFGIEIEFGGAQLDDVRNIINRKMNKVKSDESYSSWIVKDDATVQTEKFIRSSKYVYQNMDASWDDPKQIEDLYETELITFGGEVNSPILTNTIECWQDLKKACSYLRQVDDICINEKCALHFHTDKSIFEIYSQLFRYLKLWMLYEDIIYRFGYGIKNIPRDSIYKYARPINDYIYYSLSELDESNLNELTVLNIIGDNKYQGFNVNNIKVINPTGKNTYEDRNNNGTLYEQIIQNSFDFNVNLKLLCRDDNFDWDFIDYKVKHFEPMCFESFTNENTEKAWEIVTMVYKNELDKLRFMKQYLKLFSNEDIEDFKGIEKQYRL